MSIKLPLDNSLTQISQALRHMLLVGVVSLSFFATTLTAQESTPIATEAEPAQEVAETPHIELSQAMDHVAKNVVLEFEVGSTKLMDDRKICFLNSEEDHREPSNVSVVIKTGEVLDLFAAADIPDPAAHFAGKTIQVTGQVQLHNERPQILVTKVEQIKIVEDAASEVLGTELQRNEEP